MRARRLGFRPHRWNVQLTPFSVRLDEIRALETEGERFVLLWKADRDQPEWIATQDPAEVAAYVRKLQLQPEGER